VESGDGVALILIRAVMDHTSYVIRLFENQLNDDDVTFTFVATSRLSTGNVKRKGKNRVKVCL